MARWMKNWFCRNIHLMQQTFKGKRKDSSQSTYTMALTPLQYLSHMLLKRGWPPISQTWKQHMSSDLLHCCGGHHCFYSTRHAGKHIKRHADCWQQRGAKNWWSSWRWNCSTWDVISSFNPIWTLQIHNNNYYCSPTTSNVKLSVSSWHSSWNTGLLES